MADCGGFQTPGFPPKNRTTADDWEIRENSAKKGVDSSYSTPLLCPRTPAARTHSPWEDSLPTTYGKRPRETSNSPASKRLKDDPLTPQLCIELFKLEHKVLFPCYREEQVVKSSVFPIYQRDESDCEVYESDEETVIQSQGILCSQLEKSIEEEAEGRKCI